MGRNGRSGRYRTLAVALVIAGWVTASVAARELSIVATVDQTTLDVGDRVTLTITIQDEVSRLEGEPEVDIPEAFLIAGKSQSSSVSIRGRTLERSVSLTYVLIAREPGTFVLGPFFIKHAGQRLSTEAIEIVVEKPILPPGSGDQRRYSL